MLEPFAAFTLQTPAGLWRELARLDIHWLRGRDQVQSPDPAYQAKQAWLAQIEQQGRTSSPRQVLLSQDECSSFRQPRLACAYELSHTQPRAERSYQRDTLTRVVATLDAHTGEAHRLSQGAPWPRAPRPL